MNLLDNFDVEILAMDCVAIGRVLYDCWRTGRCEGRDRAIPAECHVAGMGSVVLENLRRLVQDRIHMIVDIALGLRTEYSGMTTNRQRVRPLCTRSALRARWLDPR